MRRTTRLAISLVAVCVMASVGLLSKYASRHWTVHSQSSDHAVVIAHVYASYQFNVLKNPTGLLGLNLRGTGFTLFISDTNNHIIRQFDPAGALTTIAGVSGQPGYVNGDPLSAKFNYPTGLTGRNYTWVECDYGYFTPGVRNQTGHIQLPAVQTDSVVNGVPLPSLDVSTLPPPPMDSTGVFTGYKQCYYWNYQDIYINDTQNYIVRELRSGDPQDGVTQVTTVCGNHSNGLVDAASGSACFSSLAGITDSGSGTYYIADAGNNAIRTWDGSNVSTLAGNGSWGFVDGYRTSARFMVPGKATLDSAGNLYVADIGNNAIRRIDASGNVTTLAGAGPTQPGFVGGQGSNARFFRPTSIVFNPSDNLFYIADSHNNCIRQMDANGNVTTYAGTGEPGLVNGSLTESQFHAPADLIIRSGYMYISDSMNNVIRRIDMVNGVVSTYIS